MVGVASYAAIRAEGEQNLGTKAAHEQGEIANHPVEILAVELAVEVI
jgi:hypothetical protein